MYVAMGTLDRAVSMMADALANEVTITIGRGRVFEAPSGRQALNRSRYVPHQGAREMERRRRMIAR